MVELSPEDLERVRRENREMARLWPRRTPRRFSLPLAAPLEPLPAGGHFGNRRVINGEARSPHGGVDFSADLGTPVRAAGRRHRGDGGPALSSAATPCSWTTATGSSRCTST
jgi:hypothetical protein